MTVHPHRGEGVKPLAPQKHPVMRQIGGRHFKRAPVSPVRFADPLNCPLVVAIERIGNPARRQQIGMDTAGNFRGQPFVATGECDLPLSIETQSLYSRCISPMRKV